MSNPSSSSSSSSPLTGGARFNYPVTRRDEIIDTYHNKFKIPDPYRWLEDPDSTETQEWVTKQQTLFNEYRSSSETISKVRESLRTRGEKLYNYARASCPMIRGSTAYVYKNTGLQNQDVMYSILSPAVSDTATVSVPPTTTTSTDGDVFSSTKEFMNLNTQFPDGTTALSSTSFSEDGSMFAYGLSRGGSDWVTLYVRDTKAGQDLSDTVSFVKFSAIRWTHDNKGFFYSRYPAPPEVSGTESGKAGTETTANRCAFVCYHKIGTSQTEDLLIYGNPNQPNWRYGIDITDDGEYLLLSTVKGTDPVNRLYYCHLPTHWNTWVTKYAKPVSIPPGGVPPVQATLTTITTNPDTYYYLPFVRMFDNFEAEYDVLCNDGPRFYLKTNLHAPKYRIIVTDFPIDAPVNDPICADCPEPTPGTTIDIDKPFFPTPSNLYTALPEHKEDVLDWAAVVAGNVLVTCSMHRVINVLQAYLLPAEIVPLPSSNDTAMSTVANGLLLTNPTNIPLPAPGTVGSFAGRRDQDTVFLKFVSFLHPGTILRLSFHTGNIPTNPATFTTPIKAITLPGPANPTFSSIPLASDTSKTLATISTFWETKLDDFNASDYETKQVFVPSKDGTVEIPMFIIYRKGLLTTGPAPLLQYGYGGFNISLPPNFSSLRLLWLGMCNGVYALANIRGGGELGEDWHKNGMKNLKQNCFDDFISCTEYLIKEKYTLPRKVGIIGGSNGGLLTLATALQRPDLYGCAISQVPVTDMLRFHKFTIGSAWRGEYGFAEDNEEDCEYMLRYSPLHNVKPITDSNHQLPSILITTADHDDRVVPLHSYKMIATLQYTAGSIHCQPYQQRPLLIRIESKAGHGAGKPTSKVLDEYADIYSFIANETQAHVTTD